MRPACASEARPWLRAAADGHPEGRQTNEAMGEETAEKSRRTAFDRVDGTTDPADFVRYLDTTRATEFFQEIKRRSLALLDLRAGQRALDVGCGTGDEVLGLARLVGPRGRAVGVDASATMLTEARRRAADVDLRAAFILADAQRLAFADGVFDGCR